MQIWVDADSCPRVIKEILYRAAERVEVPVTLLANRSLRIPPSRYIKTIRVPAGLNVADNRIVEEMGSGDLVVTDDIPLAADAIEKGGYVLSFRGELITEETIPERLSIRNFMDELRSSGVDTGGPPSVSRGDRQAFANQLDRFLAKHCV